MADESKQRKQYRLKILKIALENSYKSVLTSVEDVIKSLKIEHSTATTELSHLSDKGYLDHSIRGGFPKWQIKGDARECMEKNPQDYDEFVSLMEKPVLLEKDSGESGKGISKKIASILGVIGVGGIIAIVFLIVSMPNMEVAMYNSDDTITPKDNSWSTTDIELELVGKNNKNNYWADVCVRIFNTANYIESVPIGANNLKSSISTNAVCKECNSRSNHEFLAAQDGVDDCEKIQIDEDAKNMDFFIVLTYDAFLPFYNEFKYLCQYVNMTENRFSGKEFEYNCDLEYKKWRFNFDWLNVI